MKKNIQFKRIVSMILSGLLVVSSAITVCAAGTKQNSVISSFETFANYANTDGYTLPDGWKTSISPVNANPWFWSAAADESNGMKSLKLQTTGTSGSTIVRCFDQVIRSGKVHVSFDALVGEHLFFHTMEKDNGDNPNDTYTPNGQDANLKPYFFITKGESATSLSFENGSWGASTAENEKVDATSDEWHKYDLYFDLDGKKMYGYCDGIKLGSEKAFNIGLKCIAISGKQYNIDNIRIKHFLSGNNEDDSIAAAAEVHNKGNILYANVAFSEYVNITERMPSYTLKNVLTGDTVTNANAAISKSSVSGYDFTFENLDAGEYEISFNENAIKGEITNSYLLKTIRFFAPGTAKDGSDRYYYVNEDFDDYKGGMPAGWQRGINYFENDQGSTEANHYIENEQRDLGSALKLSYTTEGKADGNSLAYRFNNDIYSGKFTIEFDVKVEETTNWTMGLLTAAEFEEPEWNTTGAATSNWGASYQDLKKRMNNSYIMVRKSYEEGMYVTPDGSWWDKDATGLKPVKDEWTTVKIDVDLNNSTYTFYQNGEKKNTVGYNSNRFAKRVLKKANGEETEIKYMHGISAIRFAQAQPTAPLCIDNVKVYTEKAYNAYDTFDNTATDTQLAQQMNWYSFTKVGSQQDNAFTFGENGKGETGGGLKLKLDKAAEQSSPDATYRFAKPIKAGKSFDVDFDIKSSAEYPSLDFMIADKDDLYETAINNNYTNWQTLWRRNKVFGIGKDADKAKIQLWSRNEESTTSPVYATDSDGNYITLQPNEWNHIKFTVNNTDTTTDFVITVTDKDGNEKTASRTNVEGGALMRTQDMYALGMINPTGWSSAGGFVGVIDNLTVKEHDSFPQGKVIAINNVGFDDSVTPISTIASGVQTVSQGKYVEVKFNTPLESQEAAAQAIKAYYTDKPNTLYNEHIIPTSVTLSDDKTTAYVTLNGAEANRNIVLEIGNKMKFANSYLTSIDTTSKTFKFSELPEQSVVVSDLRFYKYAGARYKSWHAKADGVWVPVTKLSETSMADQDDAEVPTHTEQGGFKLVIEGYNPGTATKLFVAAVNYSTDENGMIELKNIPINQVIDVASGTFKQEIMLNDDIVSKDEIGNATINITGNTLRAYAWEYPSARPTVDSEEIK